MIRMGLRFRRRDAPRLAALAARVRAGELGRHHAQPFAAAARAAAAGEPLVVLCDAPIEATLMADAFVRFGLPRPAVEDLSAG